MALTIKSQDPRSLEPWWNDICEEAYHLECEARMRFEKDPSIEASKAFRKLRLQLKKKALYTQRCYEHKMRMAEKYARDYPLVENLKPQEEVVSREKKKKKKNTVKDDGTESEGDNLDLTQEMYPLSHYASDQEELISQMFSTIRGAKFEAMLPPILKSIPLQELKSLCLHELRGMSKKRIICAINGQDMEGSSESEEEEDKENETLINTDGNQNIKTTPRKSRSDLDADNENSSTQQGLPAYLMKTIKVEEQDVDSSGEKSSAGGKSVLELLELQMRARIIKTMLEKGDDGKTLTEDAIAALIGTAPQSSQVANVVSAVKVEKDLEGSEVKGSKDQSKSEIGKDAERRRKSGEGKRHRDDNSKHGRISHKKEHHRKKGNKRQRGTELRESDEDYEKKSRRDRRGMELRESDEDYEKKSRRDRRGTELRESDEDYEKKSRRDRSTDKRSQKKKKITRREFEERMKRAKKNRTYRQRKSSEDEEKANALKEKESNKTKRLVSERKTMEDNTEKSNKKSKDGEVALEKEEGEAVKEKEEGEAVKEKEEGEAVKEKEGEAVSEKEEGEWDSNEEEEGACSPSDISSVSYYSSSRSYTSRSRSRSYSRSLSRSPIRKKRGHSRGRSRSRTKSRSRSRSNERRKRDGGRWAKKRTRDHGGSGNLKMSGGIVSLPSGGNQKQQKEEEDNWGQSCDIEFVDSEEDFDDNATDAVKKTMLMSKKLLTMKGQNPDRASISFSLQKKTVPSINPNVDLDYLPLKSSSLNINREKKKLTNVEIIDRKSKEIIDLDNSKMVSDEILISSDSEHETKGPVKIKSVRVKKRSLIPSGQESECFAAKKTAVSKKTKDPENSTTVILGSGNQVTSQEVNTKSDDQIAAEVNSDEKKQPEGITKSSKPHDGKGDKDEILIRSECTDANVQIGIDQNKEKKGEDKKMCDLQKSIITEEREDENKTLQIENVNVSEETTEIQGIDDKGDNSSIGDQDFIDVETLDTADENIDNVTPKSEMDRHSMREDIEESSASSGVLQRKAEINVTSASLQMSDNVEIDMNKCRDRNFDRSMDDVQANPMKDDELFSVGNESDLSKDVDKRDKKIAISRQKDISRELRKNRLSSSKESKRGHKKLPQKIILEHLQESYNEEQESNVRESLNEPEQIISENIVENVNPDFIEEASQEGKEVSKESTSRIAELHEETHAEREADIHVQKPLQENKFGDRLKSDAQLEETQGNAGNKHQVSADDFYRGADQLTFSDDDTGNFDKEDIENIQEDRQVEPIRINTGLIRRRVTRSRKIEMAAPDKSWTKKERKKKDNSMEGIGLLKKTLTENMQSPSSKEDDDESQKLHDSSEGKEADEQGNDEDTSTSWGISSVSSREEISVDSRVQSPKENAPPPLDTSPVSCSDETSELQDPNTSQKKIGQETEIIGVIEASSNPDGNQMDEIDLGGSSWSMRWLQSEKVQKVVSSSKMLSRVRKKIQKKEKATKVVTTAENPVIPPKKLPEPVVPIIGSIEEYERLFGMKAKKPQDKAASTSNEYPQASIASGGESLEQANASPQDTPQPEIKCSTFGSDDEGEDSEEEALWSKIIGK